MDFRSPKYIPDYPKIIRVYRYIIAYPLHSISHYVSSNISKLQSCCDEICAFCPMSEIFQTAAISVSRSMFQEELVLTIWANFSFRWNCRRRPAQFYCVLDNSITRKYCWPRSAPIDAGCRKADYLLPLCSHLERRKIFNVKTFHEQETHQT